MSILSSAVGEDAALIHEEQVACAALNAAWELTDADQVNVTVLIKVAPREILLMVVSPNEGRCSHQARCSLVGEGRPVLCKGRSRTCEC